MATNETGTYQQAKDIFNNMALHECSTIDIPIKHQSTFRKHLVEMQRRKASSKRFATRLLNKTQIKVTRIE